MGVVQPDPEDVLQVKILLTAIFLVWILATLIG